MYNDSSWFSELPKTKCFQKVMTNYIFSTKAYQAIILVTSWVTIFGARAFRLSNTIP